MKKFYIYILASQRNGTLYVGMTTDLIKRIWGHKMKLIDGFTKKYQIDKLVYFEEYSDPRDAANRERNIKAWKRIWKVKLIEENNPEWNDLYISLNGSQPSLG